MARRLYHAVREAVSCLANSQAGGGCQSRPAADVLTSDEQNDVDDTIFVMGLCTTSRGSYEDRTGMEIQAGGRYF